MCKAVFERILCNVIISSFCNVLCSAPRPAAGRRHTGWSSSQCLQNTCSLTSTTSEILWNTAPGQQQEAALTVHRNKHCISSMTSAPNKVFKTSWASVGASCSSDSFHNSGIKWWRKSLFVAWMAGLSAACSLLPKEDKFHSFLSYVYTVRTVNPSRIQVHVSTASYCSHGRNVSKQPLDFMSILKTWFFITHCVQIFYPSREPPSKSVFIRIMISCISSCVYMSKMTRRKSILTGSQANNTLTRQPLLHFASAFSVHSLLLSPVFDSVSHMRLSEKKTHLISIRLSLQSVESLSYLDGFQTLPHIHHVDHIMLPF